MRKEPAPQEIYRHFKGKCYQIITLARHSENGERMVVYQQLYSPYAVYVRPLGMFMSEVDTIKYPDEKQKYRFERLDVNSDNSGNITPNEAMAEYEKQENEEIACEHQEDEIVLDSKLMSFLDTDSYERKLELLAAMHDTITDEMIDTMAISLDVEIKEGDIEQRYNEIKSCLITMERFECNRLR